mgnify:CR=1 FL=1
MNKITIISAAMAMLIATPVFSAGNGSTPNGKPFAEINGEIVEIQNDITSLQKELDDFKADVDTRFDTVEGKISAIDLKITDLESQDEALLDQIRVLVQSVADNSDVINTILGNISSLNDEITTLRDDIKTLEETSETNLDLIQANELAIETLRTDVQGEYDMLADEVAGVASILSQKLDVAEFMSQLNQYKLEVQQQFDLKQDIINAGCSDGEFLSNLQADGSFDCNAPAALANGVTRTTRYGSWVTVPHQYYGRTGSYQQSYSCGFLGLSTCYRTVYTYGYISQSRYAYTFCPAGHLRASMAYEEIEPVSNSNYLSSYVESYGTEGARVKGTNYHRYNDGKIRAVVTCFGVNP